MTITTKDKTPYGAIYNEETKSVEFRLRSKNASKVFLCIFNSPQNEEEVMNMEMEKISDDTFYTSIKDYILNCHKNPVYYGYRIFGENWNYRDDFFPGSKKGYKANFDKKGNRFNPNKIAYDPYALELSHCVGEVNPTYTSCRSGGNFYTIDNAKLAPKSVFFAHDDKEIKEAPKRAFKNEIIGEVHLKDLTQNMPMDERGTYLGAAKFAKSVKDLGITMIEFLPINEFDSKQAGGNHWGYMPLAYFSLARKYAFDKSAGNLLNEFRILIDEFHKYDIKVCLDMVYNHTGEAGLVNDNPQDATLSSYSLIDNSEYYKVFDNGRYRSNSGCGNDFNMSSDLVVDIVVDSLAFWVNQGVDAFRFDLAAALLENSCDCEEIYDNIDSLAAKLKDRLKEKGINVVDNFDEEQDGIVLIAEPWTCGGCECYQLGSFPSFWAEWNDISRDTIRKFTLRPYDINPSDLRDIFEGTPSKFEKLNKSINYIASHDGFTLLDLNTYKQKSPQTKGGSPWEISGDYNNNFDMRLNAVRKQLAFLFLSRGIPMIQIGDIIGHTKGGNSNSYNRDDSTNYLNWAKAVESDTIQNRIMEYTRNLITFRKENPIFCAPDFLDKVTYHYNNGEIADFNNLGYWENYEDLFFGALLDCENRIYIATSKSPEEMWIRLPQNKENKRWYKVIDTIDLKDIDFNLKDEISEGYNMKAHSLCIFMEK